MTTTAGGQSETTRHQRHHPDQSHRHPDRSGRTFSVPLLITLAAVLAGVLIVHWPALHTQALSFDDDQYLVHNRLVRNPGWTSAARFMQEVRAPSTVTGYYQPLNMISLMLDYAAGGRPDDLLPFRRTSLVIHALNTLLVTFLLYVLFRSPVVAGLVGMMFGAHPMTVETICWVGERKTLLASLFALIALVLYVRYAHGGRKRWYVLTLLAFILSLMSKPTGTPLPLCLLLLDYWPLKRLNRRALLEKIPFLLIAVFSSCVTYVSQKTTAATIDPESGSIGRILLTLFHNVGIYLYHIIWPVGLSSHYPFPDPLSLAHPAVLAGVIATVALAAGLAVLWRWTPVPAVCMLYFFIAILPAMQIIGFSNVIAADKFAYLPAVGLLLGLAWALTRLWFRRERRTLSAFRAGILAAACALIAGEALATRDHIRNYRDTETHFEYMITRTPRSPTLYNNLGIEQMRQKRFTEAAATFEKSIEIKPDWFAPRMNLALVYYELGQPGRALETMREALPYTPSRADPVFQAGKLLAETGREDDAQNYFHEALRLDPEHVEALNELGLIMNRRGRPTEAIAYYTRAAHADPSNARVFNNWGLALMRLEQYAEAVERFRAAVERDPGYARAHANLGLALESSGYASAAEQAYRRAIELDPEDASSPNYLGALLGRSGRIDAALPHFERALELDPGHPDAARNLDAARRALANRRSDTRAEPSAP